MNCKLDYDYIGACVDEIALEGLDGITLSALWLRLENRPHFSVHIDEKSKSFLWKIIAVQSNIEIFELPTPRPPLVFYNRYDHIDLDTGLVMEPESIPDDIYSYHPIEDGKIRGSCDTYKERQNITHVIRKDSKLLMQLEEVLEKFGECMVLVAGQDQRFLSLFGPNTDPMIEMNILQYLMVERIGRSRYQGEVTHGKRSLIVMNEPPKKLHYLRKRLLEKHIITKQAHYQRNSNGLVTYGMLIHLTRFYVEKLPKFLLMLQKICEVLETKPNRTAPVQVLQSELGLKEVSLKKLFQKHDHLVNVIMLPAREVYPDADPKTFLYVNGKERLVKCLHLPEHVDINKLEKDEEEDIDDEPIVPSDVNVTCIDRPMLNQVYKVLIELGPKGGSFGEIIQRLGLPLLDVRLLCRNLERQKLVFKVMKDAGRQHFALYVARCYEHESEHQLQFKEERRKMLEITKCEPTTSSALSADEQIEPTDVEIKCESFIKELKNLGDVNVSSTQPTVKVQQVMKSDVGHASFIEEIEKWNIDESCNNSALTVRMLRRANLILNAVRQEKLFDDTFKFQKIIMAEEMKEGCNTKVDRKSVLRIISKLVKDGYLNSYKTILQMGDKVKKLHIVCLPDIKENDPIVRSAVDRAKYKHFFSTGIDRITKAPSTVASSSSESHMQPSVHNSIQTLHHVFGTASNIKLEFRPNMGRIYGVESKFIRMQTLHQFLFYLVYEHTAKCDHENVFSIWEDADDDNGELDEQGQPSSKPRTPKVFTDDGTWRMFIPPLPYHTGWSSGWALMSDVLLRIPLSLFVKMVNITFKVDELEEYLKDPVKKHYLLAHLPLVIRSALLYVRRYIFVIATFTEYLAFIGLLSFGPHENKEKDQKFVYIHKHASLLDTTIAPECYLRIPDDLDYKEQEYHFTDSTVVTQFWCDMRDICIHTSLGIRRLMVGQEVVLETLVKKLEFLDACRPKRPDEIVDDGRIPGDHLGAAGLDSALFAHIKRNWNYNATMRKKIPSIPTGIIVKNVAQEGVFYKDYLQGEV